MSALDTQVGGNHYKNFAIQPVEFITANGLSFCIGNVIKYACRWDKPGAGGIKDLDKAIRYLQLEKEIQTQGLEKLLPHEKIEHSQHSEIVVVRLPPIQDEEVE